MYKAGVREGSTDRHKSCVRTENAKWSGKGSYLFGFFVDEFKIMARRKKQIKLFSFGFACLFLCLSVDVVSSQLWAFSQSICSYPFTLPALAEYEKARERRSLLKGSFQDCACRYHCISLSFFRMFLSFVLYHMVPSLVSFGGEKLLLCSRSSQVLKQPLALPFFQSVPTFDIHIALLHFWFSAIAEYVHKSQENI